MSVSKLRGCRPVKANDRGADRGRVGATAPSRTVLLARTRWGRIVRQEDFYEDTQAINTFETSLSGLAVGPVRMISSC